MDACDVIVQKVVTLLDGKMKTHSLHHLWVALATLQGAQKLCRKPCPAG
jgi:hypothetical protein